MTNGNQQNTRVRLFIIATVIIMATKDRKRKQKFLAEELNILVDEVAKHKSILFGAFSDVNTNQLKSRTTCVKRFS